jgi:hypothetical protein
LEQLRQLKAGNLLCIVKKVIVLMVGEAEVNIVLINNTLRDRRVLKFVLVIQAIKKYQSILGCRMTQPEIDKKLHPVNNEYFRLHSVNT